MKSKDTRKKKNDYEIGKNKEDIERNLKEKE